MMKHQWLFRRLVGLACLAASVAQASDIFVDVNLTTGDNDGRDWQHAFRGANALQNGLTAAEAAGTDTVWVAEGTYRPSLADDPNDARSATFRVPAATRVLGGFANGASTIQDRNELLHETILDGNIGDPNDATDNCYHVVTSSAGLFTTTKLSGFTICNGYADGKDNDANGGGILITGEQGSGISLDRLILRDHYASGNGGAVWMTGGIQVPLANCLFKDNRADGFGGAATLTAVSGFTTLIFFQNCIFYENHAGERGGGAAVLNPTKAGVKFSNCTFNGNVADSSLGCGGVYSELSAPFQVCSIANSIL